MLPGARTAATEKGLITAKTRSVIQTIDSFFYFLEKTHRREFETAENQKGGNEKDECRNTKQD